MKRYKNLKINGIQVLVELMIFSICFISCSDYLTKDEIIIIEKYTNQRTHDPSIFGKWIEDGSWEYKGTINKTYISFDKDGIKKERMYKDGKPFNDWHFVDYYYTDQGKIFMYRPAEKGFFAMNDETYTESNYELSKNGGSLIIGEKIYNKLK